jgi:hypothetical protein
MATFTQISNCNDSNQDETTEVPNQHVSWWTTGGLPQSLSVDGLTANGTLVSPSGQGGDYHYQWAFTKREE